MSPPLHLNVRASLADPHLTRDLNARLFSVVAPRYNAITRLLSLGRDRVWKDRMVEALPSCAAPACLDLACGTGDITVRLAAKYPDGLIIGLDLTEPMLARARARCGAAHVQFLRGDMGRTALPSASVDIVTGGYALRNAGDLREALAEVSRVLKPGGIASFLDFSKPPGKTAQWLESLLLTAWGGFWGLALHRHPGVYAYIAASLGRFPDRRELATIFRLHGLEVQASCLHFGGIVERTTVRKPPSCGADPYPQVRHVTRVAPRLPRKGGAGGWISQTLEVMAGSTGLSGFRARAEQPSGRLLCTPSRSAIRMPTAPKTACASGDLRKPQSCGGDDPPTGAA